jgi:benzil reductase ((S)-benzoin forming)
MDYYYITGTSRGIGKALAELLLRDDKNFVTGISRSSSINHTNYRRVKLDLSDTAKTAGFEFQTHKDAGKIVLVNNAGHIGEIKRAGNHNHKTLEDTYKINLTAPSILINNFINTYRTSTAKKIIFNVSSGAARHPIDAASAYCASKAGLDMLSKAVAEEQKITGSGFRIVSISVGVVDTLMQKMLRDAGAEEFSRKAEFTSYKEKGQILQPEHTAEKFIEIINNIDKIDDVVFSFREYEKMNIK